MGHYCRICGITRANEKFSGKGHKNHICKDCSGKSSKRVNGHCLNESAFASHYIGASNDTSIQLEEECIEDDWLFYIDFAKQNEEDKYDEELPF